MANTIRSAEMRLAELVLQTAIEPTPGIVYANVDGIKLTFLESPPAVSMEIFRDRRVLVAQDVRSVDR